MLNHSWIFDYRAYEATKMNTDASLIAGDSIKTNEAALIVQTVISSIVHQLFPYQY
jgi:hypothetical protein